MASHLDVDTHQTNACQGGAIIEALPTMNVPRHILPGGAF